MPSEGLDSLFEALIQTSVDAIALLDPEGRFLYVNAAFCESLGYERDALLGMSVPDINPDLTQDDLRVSFERLRLAGDVKYETRHRRRDGSLFPVEVNSNYLTLGGREFRCSFMRDISDRRRAECALQDSQRFLAELIDSLPDALFAIDADGVVTVWNRTLEELSGIPRERLLGRGDRAHALAFYGKRRPMLVDLVLGSSDAGIEHYDFVHRDGDRILAEVHDLSVFGREGVYLWAKAVALRDRDGHATGALEIIRDITEQKDAEQALMSSEARLRSLVSNTPVVIFEFDGEGIFRLVEGRGLDSLGLKPGNMVGTAFVDCFGSGPDFDDAKRRALAGERARFTATLGARVFETHLNPVDAPGAGPISVIGVAVDITERTRREAELQQRTDELTRFTYTVSHDLKSPLVTIRTFLGFLEEDMRLQDAERVAKDLEFIRNAADRMTRLLDELLELSRIGRVINAPTDFSLQDVVRDALDLVAGRIVSKGVRVRVSDSPVTIRGDRQRLVEVFQNLFDNAVKFMADQSEPRIAVEAERLDEEWIFSVIDNGIGIDPRHIHKVFGLFEQLNAEAEGTGIGLTLVKRIVEVHGGRIWVESPGIGHGSRFRFTLPEAYGSD
ncbi:PAS domain-containing sensor histidine kinase [Imhoffiella purpurea]|uniref:PAS domain-containing sensor histidine kinase n=1 Tax=Imhoffiella purpurea TaxID=1249627 RepID=UPI000694AE58|nr:PAS domain-containing sensor histidine kinase [Imhoffiella purpurea]